MSSNFSISITESDSNGSYIVYLTGHLIIENSNIIHDYLQRKAITKDLVTLNVSSLDDIDLSVLQLLIGFMITRNKLNKKTDIKLKISDNIKELINKSGFTSLISSLQKKN